MASRSTSEHTILRSPTSDTTPYPLSHGPMIRAGAVETTGFDELLAAFDQLEDPRSHVNRHHPLSVVVIISLMAVLAGADGPTGIRAWAMAREADLKTLLKLRRGLPSRDVIRRVLCALKPEAFQTCFSQWITMITGERQDGESRHVAIDGKTLKGSRSKANGLGPLHLVSAWASQRSLTLAQVSTDE